MYARCIRKYDIIGCSQLIILVGIKQFDVHRVLSPGQCILPEQFQSARGKAGGEFRGFHLLPIYVHFCIKNIVGSLFVFFSALPESTNPVPSNSNVTSPIF